MTQKKAIEDKIFKNTEKSKKMKDKFLERMAVPLFFPNTWKTGNTGSVGALSMLCSVQQWANS